MAVEVVYRTTRAPLQVFMTRQEADLHDRMLEVAENLSIVFRHVLPNLTEDDAESLSFFLSGKREELAAALKKQPSAILDLIKTAPAEDSTGTAVEEDTNVLTFANAG